MPIQLWSFIEKDKFFSQKSQIDNLGFVISGLVKSCDEQYSFSSIANGERT